MSQPKGRGALLTTILLFGALLGLANAWGFTLFAQTLNSPEFSVSGAGFTDKMLSTLSQMRAQYPGYFWFYLVFPIVLFAFTALLVGLRREATPSSAAATPEEDGPDPRQPALQLLAILQQEGRLIDFLQEEIDGYGDEQVGAAARTIHSGCRKALAERMQISRIFDQEEGASLEIDASYDPAAVRLTGNVHGQPPFRGTLEHGGWRVDGLQLPQATGGDPSIIAPAEVEVA